MTMQIKRRLSGAAGAPSGLKSGQLAWSLLDQTLYIGDGDDGAGNATNIRSIGGDGLFATKAFALTIRLDQFAAPTGPVSYGGQRITNLADPTSAQDAATKAYVDAARQGIDTKDSVVAATTVAGGNITLSGAQTIDGIAVVAGDRVLVKNQTTASQNGIYVVAAGAWTLAADADTSAKVTTGMYTFVEKGTVNAASGWALNTQGAITLGSTNLTFAQQSGVGTYSAGNGISLSGPVFAAVSANTGRIVVGASGIDLASGIVAPGTYRSLTVDTYGRATAGTNPTSLAGYGIIDAQSLNANLTSLAGLTGVADRLPYFTAASTLALATFTSFGRSLVDDADATAGRATLGLVIGTNVQAYHANLGALAGLTLVADRLPYANGAGALALATLTAFARTILDDADAAAVRTTLALVPGTDVQGFNANLASLAGLTLVADRLPYATGANTFALATFTAAGRALIDDVDAAAQRTTLGLGTMATQGANGIAVTGGTMAGVAMSSTNTFDDGTY